MVLEDRGEWGDGERVSRPAWSGFVGACLLSCFPSTQLCCDRPWETVSLCHFALSLGVEKHRSLSLPRDNSRFLESIALLLLGNPLPSPSIEGGFFLSGTSGVPSSPSFHLSPAS